METPIGLRFSPAYDILNAAFYDGFDQKLALSINGRKVHLDVTDGEHAAVAGVSVPTIAAFDRAERTLTLAEAFDILRVVGLIDEEPTAGAQNAFVHESFKRWQTLIDTLPAEASARFPHGWYRIGYCLEGDLRPVSLTEYEGIPKTA